MHTNLPEANSSQLIILNVNCLNSAIKKHRLPDWSKKEKKNIYSLSTRSTSHWHSVRTKGWKSICQTSGEGAKSHVGQSEGNLLKVIPSFHRVCLATAESQVSYQHQRSTVSSSMAPVLGVTSLQPGISCLQRITFVIERTTPLLYKNRYLF